MNYKKTVIKEFESRGWIETADIFRELNGKAVLIYTHDDPDGLTSGAILKHLVSKLGGEAEVSIPATYELEKTRLQKDLAKKDYHMVIVADKGSMGYYDEYVNMVDRFVIIDHHPPIGDIKEACLINPNTESYNMCSTSYLAHMLAAYLEKEDDYDDFLAVLGLKGDWGVEPATDYVSEYVDTFYRERVEGKFDNIVKKIKAKPTMFEVQQNEVTTLLNQIAELYFALGGGGFQYFYNGRDPELSDIDQPMFSFRLLERGSELFNYGKWSSLDDYVDIFPGEDSGRIRLIFRYFLEDWDRAVKSFISSTLLTSLGNTAIYVFLGYRIPLMPMAGSTYLNRLQKDTSLGNVLFIMINREEHGGIHFSVRSSGDEIHSGKFCSNLARRLVDKYGFGEQITGGGHIRAAECRTRQSGVTLAQSLEVFSRLVMDMDEAGSRKEPESARELGLDYMSDN